MTELTDSFKERLRFDITDGTTDFDNGNSGFIVLEIAMESGFDFICDMRNNLDCSSSVISMSFLGENGLIDLTGCDIGTAVKIFIDESFIVA